MLCPPHLESFHRACLAAAVASHYEHQLRNSLGAISSSAFFLKQRLQKDPALAADPRIEAALRMIDARAKLAAEQLMGWARPPAEGPTTELVVSDVATTLISSVEVPRGVRVTGPSPSSAVVVGRKHELELAIFCLLENAADALAGIGGSVKVRVLESDGIDHIEVEAPGGPAPGEAPAGNALAVATLLAREFGGRLEVQSGTRGVTLTRLGLGATKRNLASWVGTAR